MDKNAGKTTVTPTDTATVPPTANATKAPPQPTLEMSYRVYIEDGGTIEVAPTGSGLEIRELNEKGKVTDRIALASSQVPLVMEAMRRINGGGS